MEVKPIVVVSKCLGFQACRYNGQIENDEFVNKLNDYVRFVPVCPEIEIGLEIPRNSIRVVNIDGDFKIIETKTGRDLSVMMNDFSNTFLNNLEEVDGFLLKTRSPSCGIKDVKIYSSIDKGAAVRKGKGFFGGEVTKRYPNLAVEDEGRLKDYKIREHFLTKLYTMARFRELKKTNSIVELKKFHKYNELLFMYYNKKGFRKLSDIIKKESEESTERIIKEYEYYLGLVLARVPRYTSNISLMLSIIKVFQDKISERETVFILDTLEKYRSGNIPFSVPLYLIKGYLIRFEVFSFINQSFFEPYPHSLVEMRDSGKILT
ncbi:DUF523 and DUF1722 domain-containing protein [Clostridium sp. CX1]|uniref:YbgA family protein n=1 Tax=Clostridium sp. CX1 TaxID=2978346 RepID=UPI0021C199B9|nr:DUF523 and DUF1722 domain-containing protein [Clostridium sp. CX1]MCT8978182.1 DUF523 and DUF1722 domain-containing protein [Clostridium sp. CX1]